MSEIAFDTLVEGKPVAIEVDGTPVCVVKVADEVFAVADTCTHSEASLSEGEVTGNKIDCRMKLAAGAGAVLAPPGVVKVGPIKFNNVSQDVEPTTCA